MPPRSLLEMCMKVAIDNITLVDSFGSMPSRCVGELLRAVKSAKHLHTLEVNSDDIWDETPEQWKRLIKRDFGFLEQKYQWVPSNPRSWHRVYDKYKNLQDQNDAAATEKLQESFAAMRKEQQSKKSNIVGINEIRRLPRLPKDGRPVASGSHWSSQARAPKKSVVQRISGQVAAESRRFKLATPTGKLPVKFGQVTRAPISMIEDKRIERQFDPTANLIQAPRSISRPNPLDREREKGEARLLKIKGGTKKSAAPPPTGANVLNFDDDNEDDDYSSNKNTGAGFLDDLDLFGAASPEGADYNDQSPPAKRSRSDNMIGSSSIAKANAASSSQHSPLKRRRGGLLSAAPGITRVTRVPDVPSKSPSPPAQSRSAPSVSNPAPSRPQASSASLSSLADLATAAFTKTEERPRPKLPTKRKQPVNIFMQPKKRPRT
ncbi:hypothetical protein B0H63DRAFT_460182 [Podospora didyma]|uniref:Elongin-A n=1 Tax=Podospora didyma TaxID=330526 RepID=A0AAE0U863_9PEZI|nr:hypothetical protein B0H63DRAFT_460182 [Podospora didyma]